MKLRPALVTRRIVSLLALAAIGCAAPLRAPDPAPSTTVLGTDPGWTAELLSIPYHEPEIVVHTVVKNDTLWSIARRYDVTVTAIGRANPRLEPQSLEVGRRIRIPRRVVWPASGRTPE